MINEESFPKENWNNSPYGVSEPPIPEHCPEPHGKFTTLMAHVDADHAGDLLTRRSRSGYIIYMNNSPIYWLSKRQNSIETSSYGSEYTAMKQCCETLRGIRYKLQMMGIPMKPTAYVFGDNQSVLVNSSIPHSTLKKKSCSIAYHYVREGVANDEWRLSYVPSAENRADILSKPISGGAKRTQLTAMILHHLEWSFWRLWCPSELYFSYLYSILALPKYIRSIQL